MDFVIPQWVSDVSPWALSVILIVLLATGRLTRFHTQRVESDADKRIADAKEATAALIKVKDEAHAAQLAIRDSEITHLRDVNTKAMDALERIADAQEQSIKTTEIVKAVMQNLQSASKPRNPTGPMEKVQA
jgi:hypothetical protein